MMNNDDIIELDNKIGKVIDEDIQKDKKETIEKCAMADRITGAIIPLESLCKLHLNSKGKEEAIQILGIAINSILLELCDTTDESMLWAKELDVQIRERIIAIDNAINKGEN